MIRITANASSASKAKNLRLLRISEWSDFRNRNTQLTASMPEITMPYELVRHNSIMLSMTGSGFSSRFFQLMAISSIAQIISAYGREVTPY